MFIHSDDMARLHSSPNKLFNIPSLWLSLATYFIRQWARELGPRLDFWVTGAVELEEVVNARELVAESEPHHDKTNKMTFAPSKDSD